MFRNTSKGEQALKLHKELCGALVIGENHVDYLTLKEMIDHHMDEHANDVHTAKKDILGAYIENKIQHQVATICQDQYSPLKDLASLDILIKAKLIKLALYIDDKGKNYPLGEKDLEIIFKDSLPVARYIIRTNPLIATDPAGNYNFRSAKEFLSYILAVTKLEDMALIAEKDMDHRINELMDTAKA